MAKEAGKNCIVKVGNGATPTEVFNAVQGQRSGSVSFEADSVDVSDKTTDGWGAVIAGTRRATITVGGVAVWGDANGLDRLKEVFLAGENINSQIIVNAAGDGYEGNFSITNFEITGEHDGATEYSFTLQNAGAVTEID
jgi:TP901-1 family phage major tail protein